VESIVDNMLIGGKRLDKFDTHGCLPKKTAAGTERMSVK
jgi:hypothetical protein